MEDLEGEEPGLQVGMVTMPDDENPSGEDLNWAQDVIWVYEHFTEQNPVAPTRGAKGLWKFAQQDEKEFHAKMVPKAVEIIQKRREQDRRDNLEKKGEVEDENLRELEAMVEDL